MSFVRQANALRRQCVSIKAKAPKRPSPADVVAEFCTMDVHTLLRAHCWLWAAEPVQRQQGYAVVDQALSKTRYREAGEKKGTVTFTEALAACGWDAWVAGQPSGPYPRLLGRAFLSEPWCDSLENCRHRWCLTRGTPMCTKKCTDEREIGPDPHYLTMAMYAGINPGQRETIAAAVRRENGLDAKETPREARAPRRAREPA